MASPTAAAGFRGIDPPALRDLADRTRSLGDALIDHGREAAMLGRTWDRSASATAGIRLEQLGVEMGDWALHLITRAALIEASRRVVWMLTAALGGVGAAVGESSRQGSIGGRDPVPGSGQPDPAQREIDLPAVATWFDRFLLLPEGSATDADRRSAAALLELLSPDDLVDLLRIIQAGGHDAVAAARLGDVIGSARLDLSGLAERLGGAMDAQDPFVAAVIGHAMTRCSPAAVRTMIAGLLGTPGRLGTAVWGAGIGVDAAAIRSGLDQLEAAILSGGDAVSTATAAAELMAETQRPHGLMWLAEVDRVITSLLAHDAAGVLGALADRVDPEGRAVVPWIRRLFTEPAGPEHLHTITAGFVGDGPVDPRWLATVDETGRHARAIAVGYFVGVLVVATRLEGHAAHDAVAALGRFAAVGEAMVSLGSKVAAVLDMLLPGSFGFGIDVASGSADARIDTAMWRLLGAIEARFEPGGDAGEVGLGGALLALDDRRDELVGAWLP